MRPELLIETAEVENIVGYGNTGRWAAIDWFVPSEVIGYCDGWLDDASMAGWSLDPRPPLETGKALLEALGRWLGDHRG